MGPRCPTCARRPPFWRTQWGLGQVFRCAGCGASLMIPATPAMILTLALFTVFWFGSDYFPAAWGGAVGLVGLILLIGAPLVWAISRAQTVEQ